MKNMSTVLLIHPPVTKPSEPPAGIARLSGALSWHGVKHSVIDLNLECFLDLLSRPVPASDRWTSRASRNLGKNIGILRAWTGYASIDRYTRTISDLQHILHVKSTPSANRLSFSDYQHSELSPLRSDDLLKAAEDFENSLFYPYFSKRLRAALEQTGAGIAGFSLNYLSQALCAFSAIGFLKKTMPDLTIVLGGSLITSWMKRGVWKSQFEGIVDSAVSGEGERPLLSMLGVTVQEDRKYRPSFQGFPLTDYLAPGPILPYSTSTGCYWGQCSFCPEKAEGNTYVQLSKKIVADELRKLVEDVRPALIHLVDNAVGPAVMEKLCAEPPRVSWYGFARLTPHLANPDFCHALKQSGCVMLKLGLESGSQAVLDAMQKGNNLDWSSAALISLKKAGIATYAYLLFGTPWETEIEAKETLEFVAHHSAYIDFLNIAVFNLPARNPDTRNLVTADFYDGDLSLYTDFLHPRGWDRRNVKQFLDRTFKRHPAIQPILRRHPPGFGSNHAPLFAMNDKRGNARQNLVK